MAQHSDHSISKEKMEKELNLSIWRGCIDILHQEQP